MVDGLYMGAGEGRLSGEVIMGRIRCALSCVWFSPTVRNFATKLRSNFFQP